MSAVALSPIPLVKNLQVARRARGLTLAQVGLACGRTWRTIYNWEAGTVEPSLTMIRLLARVYQVRPDRLMFESSDEFRASFSVSSC